MNDIENVVSEDAENVEATATEEIVENEQIGTEDTGMVTPEDEVTEKVYSEEEFNKKLNERLDEIIPKRVARNTAKIRKEYEDKYGELERVMIAGTGEKDISNITKKYRQYYEAKGIQIPNAQPEYSARDIEVLANAEASDIIGTGFDEVVAETDRLARIGAANMNAREKAVFKHLADYRQKAERSNELAKIGVSSEVYDSSEFRDFASQFNSNVPVSKVYEMYNRMQPKKEVRTMGSMAGNAPKDTGVKEFYTRDEALKFSKKDFDNNEELYKAVQNSMLKW